MKLKKILIFCILIFSIIFISEASTEKKNVLKDDGTDWTNLTDLERLIYVNGFTAGAGLVWSRLHDFGDSFKTELDKEMYNVILNETSLATKATVGQIKDGMNVFYSDFSNRRIKIVDAIYVVNIQIKGEDPELINSQIRYLKMQPIDREIYVEAFEKYIASCKKKGSYPACLLELKNGDFSFEDLLKAGIFMDANDILHHLFCYGKYK